jgi:hypothetical protein
LSLKTNDYKSDKDLIKTLFIVEISTKESNTLLSILINFTRFYASSVDVIRFASCFSIS